MRRLEHSTSDFVGQGPWLFVSETNAARANLETLRSALAKAPLAPTIDHGSFGEIYNVDNPADDGSKLAVKCALSEIGMEEFAETSLERCIHKITDDYAVRRADESAWSLYYNEYKAMLAVGSEYAPEVYAFGGVIEPEGDAFEVKPAIVMERLDSGDGWLTLKSAIESNRALRPSTRNAATVGALLARALGRLRRLRLLHHDLSAKNIFLHITGSEVDRLKLIDFGQVARVDGTFTPLRWGTYPYAAPEMINHHNTADLDEALKLSLREAKNQLGSDVWSLGAILYLLRTGHKPPLPSDGSAAAIIMSKLEGLSLPSDCLRDGLDRSLDSIISDCTNRRTDHRPAPKTVERKLLQLLLSCNRQDDDWGANMNADIVARRRVFPGDTEPAPFPGSSTVVDNEASPMASDHVYGMVYRVSISESADGPKVLVLSATAHGCKAHSIVMNGERRELVHSSGLISVPDDGWAWNGDSYPCPWQDISVAYIRETIRPKSMCGWFAGCRQLETIKGLQLIDTSEVESLEAAFYQCSSLVSLDISGWDVSSVRKRENMVEGCPDSIALQESELFASSAASTDLEEDEEVEHLYPKDIEEILFPDDSDGVEAGEGVLSELPDSFEEFEKITIKRPDGAEVDAEVMLCFSLEKYNHTYLLYTLGENDAEGYETIHGALLTEDEERYQLGTVPDEEWDEIKEIMRIIIENED